MKGVVKNVDHKQQGSLLKKAPLSSLFSINLNSDIETKCYFSIHPNLKLELNPC